MTNFRILPILLGALAFLNSCKSGSEDARIFQMDPAKATALAKAIDTTVKPTLAEGLTLQLWAMDSLVADPVSIDIDDQGRIYYTRTNRQKNSEFDIRGHQDWEIESISLKNVEEKRAFLRKVLAPENSSKNMWLTDVNGDSSRDWRDMTVEKEHVYRVEDTDGDGYADKTQRVVEDFNTEITDAAGGVLKHGDDLFVGIGPDLWRIKENKKGIAEKTTSISHGYGIHVGFSGHGMSGIEVGPEGKIYWQIGDIGFSGTDKSGKKWEHPNSGVIVRSNPDGSDFEVFAYGNRNTHEFVFDQYGNLISEDNDGDHRGESERLVYIVNGADIGWRTNWQFGKYRDPNNNTYKVWMDEKMYVPRWEGQAAYITPTIKNFVNGPTGMVYNPGTAMGKEYLNTFFIAEFVGNPARSGIHAFKLKPKGATFDFDTSKQVVGGLLATGIDFGPDGALYMGDWIEGWDTKDYGRIWKLDVANPNVKERKDTEKHIKADFTAHKNNDLRDLLKHADMRVRQKAQFELANRGSRGLEIFKQVLADKSHQLARVHAIWGISQFARKKLSDASALVPYLQDADPEIRAQAARWIGDVRYKEAGTQLIALLKDSYPRARFFAAEALGRTEHAAAIQPIIAMLVANNEEDNYLRHAGSLALARIGQPAPVVALSKHPSRAARIAAVVALRRMQDPGIKVFLKDSDVFVVTEAARAINDDLSITGALADLAEALNDRRFSNEAFVRRAINANLRLGTEENLQNLISYMNDEKAPVVLRSEAMDALSTWAKPSVLDRVDGRYRGEVTRDAAPVRKASMASLLQLLIAKDSTLREHAALAFSKLEVDDAAAQILAQLQKEPAASARIEMVKALVKMKGNHLDQTIRLAMNDKEKSVRAVGLKMIGSLNIPREVMVVLLEDVIKTRTPEEKQAAVTVLGKLPLSHTEKVFAAMLDQMEKKQLPLEVHFELSDAIDSTGSAALKSRYEKLITTTGKDSLKARYAGAISGGDPRKGSRIFWNHQTAQCIRCHAYDDAGGNAGPRLNGVAERLTKEQLLEALIEPSARIAPGFGKPPSSMPPMHLLLNKKELRDVLAFLQTMKEEGD
jgi:HEAT repeat protein/glucose/arabinose dehydrogenase/mono/diheme cytochrome c family protein